MRRPYRRRYWVEKVIASIAVLQPPITAVPPEVTSCIVTFEIVPAGGV
jgi:hypothetical protein